ncbi:hypothetical protein BDV26DRAFT_292577 [Aspergillus bertholletiae]|uniref:Translation initiation factor 5A-like N-terminal domain-containing protein n=1 Tax=Aspergillus bertholletiae TaxID=1226010 RepID=A0A5N7B8N5_9EURO|nr:hypothetical protein BDV26DRAFT_292577 [Aspergillus bertholletiae]
MSFHFDDYQGGNSQYGNTQYGNTQYGNGQYGNDQYGNDQYGSMNFGFGGPQSEAFPTPCSSLKTGGLVLLQGHPCQITDIYTTSPGGSVVQIVGTNVLTGEVWKDVYPLRETVFVPRIRRENYVLTSCGRNGRMDLHSNTQGHRADVRVPGGQLGARIRKASDAGQSLILEISEYSRDVAATKIVGPYE